jgi:hypothetical protein
MKFISKLLNLILLCVTFCAMTLTEWCVYNLIALPEQSSRIAIASKDENVSYVDTFTWLGTDLGQSLDLKNGVGPRYDVRSWSGWGNWAGGNGQDTFEPMKPSNAGGMGWADYAIEAVIGASVPIFAPTYEVKQLAEYRLNDYDVTGVDDNVISTFGEEDKFMVFYQKKKNTGTDKDPKYEQDVSGIDYWDGGYSSYTEDGYNFKSIEKDSTYEIMGESIYKPCRLSDSKRASVISDTDNFKKDPTLEEVLLYDFDYIQINDVFYRLMGQWNDSPEACGKKYSPSWMQMHHSFYNNIEWKIRKYNNPAYDRWIKKFFVGSTQSKNLISGRNDNGDMIFKTSVPVLYFQFYLALALSIWFVIQNPIVVKRNVDGEEEVSGGLRRLFAARTDRERKLQQEEADGRRWHRVFHFHHKKKDGKAKI